MAEIRRGSRRKKYPEFERRTHAVEMPFEILIHACGYRVFDELGKQGRLANENDAYRFTSILKSSSCGVGKQTSDQLRATRADSDEEQAQEKNRPSGLI